MSNRRGFTVIELMIVVVIVGIIAVLAFAGYYGVHHRAPKPLTVADVTYDARYSATMPIVQDAVYILYLKGQPESNGCDSVSIATSSHIDACRTHFKTFVEYNNLTNYKRFIVADDSTTRVIITYPTGDIVAESK